MGETQNPADRDPNLAFDQPVQPADGSPLPVEEVFPVEAPLPAITPMPAELSAPEESRGMSAGNTPLEDEVILSIPDAGIEHPPASSTAGMPPIFSTISLERPDIGGFQAPPDLETEVVDEKLLQHLVTQKRMEELWERLNTVTRTINNKIQSLEVARQLYEQVKFARRELIAGREHFDEAERYVNEVEYRASHATTVMSWSFLLGVLIFVYEIGIAVGLVYILFVLLGEAAWMEGSSRMTYIAASMVFGSLGGVIGASFSLVKHVAVDQDFEWQHSQWYFASPVMGAGVGLVVYMILLGSMNSMVGGAADSLSSPIIIYLLAWLAGYQHNVFTDMIKRILKVFENQLGGPGSQQAESPSPKNN